MHTTGGRVAASLHFSNPTPISDHFYAFTHSAAVTTLTDWTELPPMHSSVCTAFALLISDSAVFN